MSRPEKVLQEVLSGRSDSNIRFRDLCGVLERLGFKRRVRGSHHMFKRPGVSILINLQEESGMAIRYQVRQVRRILIDNGLTSLSGDSDVE